ncbi:helix-turn-helix domain-containing protein [Methylomonas sp. MS20]|uniref:helix-turn-helix domain-containing protein n=1 Tax=unclassified Methylomonas TaxID=2608980 RepID=UPI0028A37195|nr:helix-turn-helix domain-containing protein [Methylomonas sp. MV1]MDT4330842.1 helix-turn-helix domain-containing protein [Methylomonas sp. MV1]
MEILTLQQAAEMLMMHPIVLARKTKSGEIPGKKPGRRWIYVKEHLADWISGRYPDSEQALRVIDGAKPKEENPCPSSNVAPRGGLTSPRQTANEYADLLKLKSKEKPKNCMTSSGRSNGRSASSERKKTAPGKTR